MKKSSLSLILSGIFLAGCATKNFGELHDVDPSAIEKMTCADIEKEFFRLTQYEDSVDEEASTGQAKQIFWGGLWSVMADEKLEAIARKDIRARTRLLYDLKIKKGCK